MKNDFLVAITQICSEKNLPKEIVVEAIEQALISAFKRNFGGTANITAVMDPNTGKAKIFAEKAVVELVQDRRAEISLDDARRQDPLVEIGGTVKIESTPDDFGRIAAQTAKQVVLQRIREAERDALYNFYAERDGEIVLGNIQQMDNQSIAINLGRIEASLPRAEQIPNERYRHNQKIRALIIEVNKSSRGPQVILSRTHRNMLRRLFELEVPEIFNGQVEIKAIAREPGQRSKIAVAAKQDGIDPVGACIGQRGVRIQNVVNELSGEKIDIVEWSSNPATLIANSISPAKAVAVDLQEDDDGNKVAYVIVQDRQLSLAIGKEGQNARLAAKLTGWRIDFKSETQAAEARAHVAAQEAERLAALTPEQIAAEQVAPAEELPAVLKAAAPIEMPAEPVTLTPIESSAPAPIEASLPAPAPIAEVVIPALTGAVEPDQTFEEALAESEEEPESLEEAAKKKADKRKRQVLVFDAKLGKVVARKRHKGARGKDWVEEDEPVEDETTEEVSTEGKLTEEEVKE